MPEVTLKFIKTCFQQKTRLLAQVTKRRWIALNPEEILVPWGTSRSSGERSSGRRVKGEN